MHQKQGAQLIVFKLYVNLLVFLHSLSREVLMCGIIRLVDGVYISQVVLLGFGKLTQVVILLAHLVVQLQFELLFVVIP